MARAALMTAMMGAMTATWPPATLADRKAPSPPVVSAPAVTASAPLGDGSDQIVDLLIVGDMAELRLRTTAGEPLGRIPIASVSTALALLADRGWRRSGRR